MENNNSKIIIEDTKNEFLYKKNKSNLNISFNRVAFIFIFFIITLIYSIHLIHLGSRKINNNLDNGFKEINNKLYRADFVDRKGRFISKTRDQLILALALKK